jgi:hypothetical protein
VTPAEHNDRRWLKVVRLEREYPWLQDPRGRFICGLRDPGWYVIRTCPCHPGVPITRPLPSRAWAMSAMWAMLRVSAARGELGDGAPTP